MRAFGVAVMLALIPTSGLALRAGVAHAACERSSAACDIICTTAVTSLPPPLRALFEPHLDTLRKAGVADVSSLRDHAGNLTDHDHFFVLDGIVGNELRSLQQDRTETARVFKRRGIEHGGQLPWAVLDHHQALVRAFTSRDDDLIIHETGVLLHLVTDASMPFSTTLDRLSQSVVARRAPEETEPESGSCPTVRWRVQVGLLNHLSHRLEYEVRVFPGRVEDLIDPKQAVFKTLIDSHGELSDLISADAAVFEELRITDTTAFEASAKAYYREMANRTAGVMESRLEAGALLGARLITTAWTHGGSPNPIALRPHLSGQATPNNERRADTKATTSPFVGSRHSKIFHRATCPHARRIKPENVVHFDSAEAATRAGRIPCKTCNPSSP